MSSQQISPATVGGLPRPVIVPGVPQDGGQAWQMGAATTEKHQALLNAATGTQSQVQKGGKKYGKRITRGRKGKKSVSRKKRGGAASYPPTSEVPKGHILVPVVGSGAVQAQAQGNTVANASNLLLAQSQASGDKDLSPPPPLPGKPMGTSGGGMKGGKSRRMRYKKSIVHKSRSRKYRKTMHKRRR